MFIISGDEKNSVFKDETCFCPKDVSGLAVGKTYWVVCDSSVRTDTTLYGFMLTCTVNSLLTDTTIRRTPCVGPRRFSVISLYLNSL